MKQIVRIVVVLLVLSPFASSAMSLDDFLKQVGEKNGVARSQRLNEEAFQLRAKEGDLVTTVNLFASGQLQDDRRESQNPLFEGERRQQHNYQLGLDQTTIFGLSHKLYFGLDRLELIGVDPAFFPEPGVSKSSFNYELTFPFLRNGFGRNTRNQVASIKEQNRSESLTARFSRKQLKVNAIAAYWQLKSAQELLKLLREQLEANEKFLSWTRARVRDRLSETTDLRQAEAVVALRKFEIESARAELVQAGQTFNEMLQISVETVVPDLETLPNPESLPKPSRENRSSHREDLASLEALLNAQKAQAKAAAENTKPLLDLNASVSSNGLDSTSRESFDKSLTTNNPAFAIGLKVSIPLDRSSVGDVQKSALLQAGSLEAQLERKRFEVAAEFEKLKRNYDQAMRIFDLSRDVEKAQLSKYETESERRRIGRTSTFQLLSFQQEYLQAKQALIRAQSTVVQMNSQFLLFDSEDSL